MGKIIKKHPQLRDNNTFKNYQIVSVVAKQRSLSRRRRKTTVSQRESTIKTTNQQLMTDRQYIGRCAVPETLRRLVTGRRSRRMLPTQI